MLGRHDDALAAATEAVAISRNLAGARPGAFRPHLAAALNNLGNVLSMLNRHADALTATAEAVAIRRDLARALPDAFMQELAMSLANLARISNALGRHDEARAALQEASELVNQGKAPPVPPQPPA